ncbi:hypothetical protein X975_24840, partial [Stegodyphus mimosarum]
MKTGTHLHAKISQYCTLIAQISFHFIHSTVVHLYAQF